MIKIFLLYDYHKFSHVAFPIVAPLSRDEHKVNTAQRMSVYTVSTPWRTNIAVPFFGSSRLRSCPWAVFHILITRLVGPFSSNRLVCCIP